MDAALKGSCLCGSLTISVAAPADTVEVCHCAMCRKWSAGPFMAVGGNDSVDITGNTLGVYQSSEWAERVFCTSCGTNIAWRLRDKTGYHVSAGLFGEADRLPLGMQVFIDEKPDNYSFEQQTRTMTAAEIFALFAEPEGNAN